jgi:hypothetical protein
MPKPNIQPSEPRPGNQPAPAIIDRVEPAGSLAETIASTKRQVDAGNAAK